MLNSTKVGGVHFDITARDAGFRTELAKAEMQARATGNGMAAAMTKADAATKSATASVGALHGGLAKIVAAGFLLHMATQAVKTADSFSLMRSRIRLVVQEGENLEEIEERLAEQAIANRAGLKETVALYSRLRAVRRDLSDEAARQIVDTWAKTLIVSGASAQEAAAATMQFGQAMASGRLAGDELRTILETNSRFAILLADGLGVTVGELRKLGEEGRLTTDAIIGAFKAAGASLEADFQKKALTAGQAFTNLTTAITRLIGVADQATGASEQLAKWIDIAAKALNSLSVVMARAGAEARRYEQAEDDLAHALERYQRARQAANIATDEGREAAKEALDVARDELRVQEEKNKALVEEARLRLMLAKQALETSGALGAARGDVASTGANQRMRRELDRIRELEAQLAAVRAEISAEDAISERERRDRAEIRFKTHADAKAGASLLGEAASPEATANLRAYRTALEALEIELREIAEAKAADADKSRAAVAALLDYASATDSWGAALEQANATTLLSRADRELLARELDRIAQSAADAASEFDGLDGLLRSTGGVGDGAFGDGSDFGELPEIVWPERMWEGFGYNVRDATKWGLMEAIESGDWSDAFADVLRNVARAALSRSIDNLIDNIGGRGGGLGDIFGTAVNFFGGGRAGGGPVRAGVAYTVGEMGAETFIPGVSGFVVPRPRGPSVDASTLNQSSSITVGGANIVINGNLDGVTMPQLEAALAAHRAALPGAVRSVMADRRRREGW